MIQCNSTRRFMDAQCLGPKACDPFWIGSLLWAELIANRGWCWRNRDDFHILHRPGWASTAWFYAWCVGWTWRMFNLTGRSCRDSPVLSHALRGGPDLRLKHVKVGSPSPAFLRGEQMATVLTFAQGRPGHGFRIVATPADTFKEFCVVGPLHTIIGMAG